MGELDHAGQEDDALACQRSPPVVLDAAGERELGATDGGGGG